MEQYAEDRRQSRTEAAPGRAAEAEPGRGTVSDTGTAPGQSAGAEAEPGRGSAADTGTASGRAAGAEAEPDAAPDVSRLRRCRRCFLYEMDGQETSYESILRLSRAMPAKEKADDAEYGRRLSVCRECRFLDNATCMQCGCYAEVRALKRTARCPVKKW